MRLPGSIAAGLGGILAVLGVVAQADEFEVVIPMHQGGASTFYVTGQIGNTGEMDFMVDTGSGYLTINEETLALLEANDGAEYRRDLRGILADGSELIVPVYEIRALSIGDNCHLGKVEAAVFPGTTRQILGLNVLRMAAPFAVSFDPPNLTLSNCQTDAQNVVAANSTPIDTGSK